MAVHTVEAGRGDEALLGAVIDTIDEAFVLADHDGRITEWNPAAERTFGYRRAEVLGLTLAETLVPPSMRAAHAAGMERFLATGEGRAVGKRLELPALHKQGHEIPVEMTITAVRAAGGRWRFAALVHEISERLASEAGLRRLAAIVAATDEGIVALTGEGLVASWNPGARRVTGHRDAAMVGQPFSTLFAPGGEGQAKDLLRRCLGGESVRIDTRFARNDGTAVPVALTLSALPAGPGETAGATALFRDITERKVTEERLAAFARRQRELAKRDDLTGVYNHRTLHEGLDAAIGRGLVSVVRIEVRGLRAVNARLGAQMGDRVLRDLARLLTAHEGAAWAGRIAGGEFALVLPGVERIAARRAANTIAEAFVAVAAGAEVEVGVAATSDRTVDAATLLRAAERDLAHRNAPAPARA